MKTTKNLKNFVGERAYNIIKNISVDENALRKALVTPQNARNVFADLTEFETKAICAEISNSGTIGQVRKTTQKEIVAAFNAAGYDRVIFDNKEEIEDCRKYYQQNETICTYNNLQSRMKEYHMLVAVKANIDKIERADTPQREDEYGTSILNIQIAKNGSHMSIKNRYNHTVSQPDSTLNNNLDMLYYGLQSMVLGYYGFASLSNKKQRYDYIVNIGGVYLKYHTEQNNVYVGAFALDGVNGARFTDASRYYVVEDKDRDNYYKEPLVLDFKNKEVISLGQGRAVSSGRAHLLTRVMQDGALSSANKEEADTFTATFADAKKELLKCNKNALKYIHEAYGYDFTKPHTVTGFLGKFTAKSIEKASGADSGILFVYTGRELCVVELDYGKFNTKGLRRMYNYGIDAFYRQGDFEGCRKSWRAAAFFVHQEKQYVGNPEPEQRNYYSYSKPAELDKSGNDLAEVKRNLASRLSKYKTAKRAREAAEIDYTKDIAEINNAFTRLKAEIVTVLSNAETTGEYSKVSDATGYRLVWLVRDIKQINKCVNEKSFRSVEAAHRMINDAKSTLATMLDDLQNNNTEE